MKFFQNLKLSQKFLLLIIIMLMGFGAIAMVYRTVLNAEALTLARAEQVGTITSLIDKIEIKVLDARRFEKELLQSNKLEFLEKFNVTLNEAKGYVQKLSTLLQGTEEQQLLNQISETLQSYQDNFQGTAEELVAVGLDENSGLLGELRTAAHDLEGQLKTAGAPQLMVSHLLMRRHEKDFLARKEDKYVQRMAAEADNFRRLLADAQIDEVLRGQLADGAMAYNSTFNDLAEAMLNQLQRFEVLTQTIEQLNPTLDAMLQFRNQRAENNLQLASTERKNNNLLFLSTLGTGAAIVSLLVFLLSRGITQSITSPIAHLHGVVSQITAGDFDVRAQLDTRDELGTLGSALDNLLDERVARLQQAEQENERLNDSVISLLTGVAQLSKRDLTIRVPVTEDVTGPVADSINLLTDEMANLLEGVRTISNQVASASVAVKSHSDTVVAVADKERKIVDTTAIELASAAEAMDQINALAQASNSAADKAIQATQLALEAVTSTVEGINGIRETIRETEKRTKRLGERTQEITGTVNLINNIAERTHILALNASMHAASAGEAGRGFAVVADEVQRLAENAREATSQISALVGNIQMETTDTLSAMNTAISQVVDGTKLAQQAGAQMQSTQQSTSELVQSVQRIAESAREQTNITKELRERAVVIQKSTEQTRSSLDDQTKQTKQLLNFSKQLLNAVGVFKLPSQISKAEKKAAVSDIPAKSDATPLMEDDVVLEQTS